MLRLQAPLPERYTGATEDELHAMIGAAKAALGSRLFVLGHHYQRDEVMRWADARGDSFGLSRLAADQADAEFIVLIKAFDDTFAQNVFARSSYKSDEVAWGMRFVPMVSPRDAGGMAVVDLTLLDEMEPSA